jgi:signal transduction histidine kinase
MPIRLRLALWSGAILAAGLIGFSVLIYLLTGHTLRSAADDTIASRAERIHELLAAPPAEDLTTGQQQKRLVRIAQVFRSQDLSVLLLDEHGKVLAQSQGVRLPAPGCESNCRRWAGHPYLAVSALSHDAFYDRDMLGVPFRIFAMARGPTDHVRYILVGHSVKSIDDTLRMLLTVLLGGSAICLSLVCAAAWFLARRALAPIAAITTTAARIAESGDFAGRVRGSTSQDEVGRLTATFNTMLNRLEALHAAQRRFVSDASHELRAPLTTIRGNAELLLLDPTTPPEEREAALRDIAEEAARLTRLVEGLLALARGDARQRWRPQPLRLHELVLSACQSLTERPRCPAVTLARNDPVLVHADPDRLEQLLIILLDNACKYTPPDGRVSCSLLVEGRWATLTVRDTGIGIHPDDLPHIFERFYRADRARTHEWPTAAAAAFDAGAVPGTGLGLAIARQIVEEAGGTIVAESEPGMGTAFSVHLPLYELQQAVTARAPARAEAAARPSHV